MSADPLRRPAPEAEEAAAPAETVDRPATADADAEIQASRGNSGAAAPDRAERAADAADLLAADTPPAETPQTDHPRASARKAAEAAGRRTATLPAASLLSVAPKPRRQPTVEGAPGDAPAAPAIPGLPPGGKRDLTRILRQLNDPTVGEVSLDRGAPTGPTGPSRTDTAASGEPRDAAASTAPTPGQAPVAPSMPTGTPAAADLRPSESPAPAEPPSTAVAAAPAEPAPTAPAPVVRLTPPAEPVTDMPVPAAPDPTAPAAPTPEAPAAVEAPAAADGADAPAAAASSSVAPRPAAAEAARPGETPSRGGLFSFAGRAMRLVAGRGRGREADAVTRRQAALVAAVRERDAAAHRTPHPPSAPTPADAASALPNGSAAGTRAAPEARADRSAGARAPAPEAARRADGDLPVTLLRRGEGGLVEARRLRPGPRGPEDLVRLWLEHRGTGDVPPWSAFPATLVGAQWPNTLLLTVDRAADAAADPAGAFASILRLDRADRPHPAGVPRIVYTPTMTEWILAMARESQRASRVLRDRDEFVTAEGRLGVRLVALPLGEDGRTVDRVLCHLAAERPA